MNIFSKKPTAKGCPLLFFFIDFIHSDLFLQKPVTYFSALLRVPFFRCFVFFFCELNWVVFILLLLCCSYVIELLFFSEALRESKREMTRSTRGIFFIFLNCTLIKKEAIWVQRGIGYIHVSHCISVFYNSIVWSWWCFFWTEWSKVVWNVWLYMALTWNQLPPTHSLKEKMGRSFGLEVVFWGLFLSVYLKWICLSTTSHLGYGSNMKEFVYIDSAMALNWHKTVSVLRLLFAMVSLYNRMIKIKIACGYVILTPFGIKNVIFLNNSLLFWTYLFWWYSSLIKPERVIRLLQVATGNLTLQALYSNYKIK